jgi:hypothetical protein
LLEVHPAHHAATTWRDFLIHIATIVIGLLIAVSLEQTIEYLHHRHQVQATREALRLEADKNREEVAKWVIEIRRQHAALDNNLLVLMYLKQHPGTPQSQLPGILTWHNSTDALATSAWSTARQSMVLALFPDAEISRYSRFYYHIDLINHASDTVWEDVNTARLYAFRDGDPSHMSASQIDRTIELTQHALKSLFLFGVTVGNLHDEFADFAPGLTNAELNTISHGSDMDGSRALAGPMAQTIDRIDAAGKMKDYFPQSGPPTK